ncbi:MAG: hypothetical protein R3220_00740 [Balneolaceae bacterium]|nr:hypothetical protein [Balneolaceae bacterium]
MDSVPSFVFSTAIAILTLSVLAVIFKKGNYQVLSLISGLIILLLIVSSKPLFSNSLTFVACLLVLIGLVRDDSFIFRLQISFLYIGAAMNKWFDPDWWNGHYFDFFLRDVFDVGLYQTWISTDHLAIAKALGITTIFSEMLLAVIVLVPKLTRLTIIIGLIFHGGMLVITSGQLSVRFLYIMSAAFLLISKLKLKPLQVASRSAFLTGLLTYMDLSDSVTSKTHSEETLLITAEGNRYTGRKAWNQLLLSKQFLLHTYFLGIILYMITPFLINKIGVPLANLF